jgi:ABC-type antimicrobial peptide transport system permease subunit
MIILQARAVSIGEISAILGVIISVSAVIGIIAKQRDKIKKWFADRRGWKTMLIKHDERIQTIEGAVEVLQDGMSKLNETFAENVKDSKNYRKASIADKLFNHVDTYTKQGYITQLQLQYYNQCEQMYKNCLNGDSTDDDMVLTILRDKIKALPIKAIHPFESEKGKE